MMTGEIRNGDTTVILCLGDQ